MNETTFNNISNNTPNYVPPNLINIKQSNPKTLSVFVNDPNMGFTPGIPFECPNSKWFTAVLEYVSE
jgi:hypothetical protein